MKKKQLPTLTDSDIVTDHETKRPVAYRSVKLSTIAIALGLTTASSAMLTSCSDGLDCDSDYTHYADPGADSYDVGNYDTGIYADSYDYGQYDTSDSDTTRSGDAKICD